jgi:hypothetical protein
MTALRPPTRAVKDAASGEWVQDPHPAPGSLGKHPIDPAPPEHPVAQGWTGGFLDEESYQWVRDPKLLSDQERLLLGAIGPDVRLVAVQPAALQLISGRCPGGRR